MSSRKRKTYKEMLEKHPEFKGVITERSWDFIAQSDKNTIGFLKKDWLDNLEKNVKTGRYKRQGGMDRDCVMAGKNKAVVGIGAGPSLNKNKHVLKALHDLDGTKPWSKRNFIFIASNHMFKPLLQEGIIPDFVMLADASDVVMDQLTTDIPESGRNCILITGLHCHPRVLKRWEKQGRDIRFYLTSSPGLPEKYEELTGKDPEAVLIQQGGNVLNSAWSVSLKFLGSSVFMALGNDLSYPLLQDDKERRKSYYADNDYSTNEGTGRDEAARTEEWPGISSIKKSNVVSNKAEEMYDIELDLMGCTGNLWVYKTWLEANVLAHGNQDVIRFNYYNCTEGGVAGVMCKDDTQKGREDISNWFLLDSVCKRWRTRMFKDAISEFLYAKDMLKCPQPKIHTDVRFAIN